VLDLTGKQFTIPSINYRFWLKSQQKMFDVISPIFSTVTKEITDVEVGELLGDITKVHRFSIDAGVLIPSTGYLASGGKELFYGDMVHCSFLPELDKNRMVFWDNGWRILGVTTDEFKDNLDRIHNLGSKWENITLYSKYYEMISSTRLNGKKA
jgi:hypothetical protein